MTGREHNYVPLRSELSHEGNVVRIGQVGKLPPATWEKLHQIPEPDFRHLVSVEASRFVDEYEDHDCKQLVRRLNNGVDNISGQPRMDAPTTPQAFNVVLVAAERHEGVEQGAAAAIQGVADRIFERYQESQSPPVPDDARKSWLGGLMSRFR